MLHIGCHLSCAKGYLAMGEQALALGADTFQFFTRNPRGGAAKSADPADAAVHFGLLSYAAGLVSRHYVAQLRSQAPTVDKAAKAGKERKDHA